MWSSLLPPLRGAALVATVYLAATAAGVPQEDPPKTTVLQTGSVRDALQGLESQVRELNAALLEMQAQVTRSRAEAQELRKDLEAARGQLASFKSELEESRGPVAPRPGASVPGAATGATATPNREVDSAAGAGEAAQPAEVPLGPQVAELGERVANLEEDQQLLGAKVVDQYQTKVESGSKYRVRLSGIALLNVFGTRGSVDNLVWRISGDPGWSHRRTGPAPDRDGPLGLGAHVHRCRAGYSFLLSPLADLAGLAGLPGAFLFRQPVDVDTAAPRGTAAGSVRRFQHLSAGWNPRFAHGSAALRPVLSVAPGGRKKRAAGLCDETGVDAHGIRPSAHGRRCGLLCATELGIRPRC